VNKVAALTGGWYNTYIKNNILYILFGVLVVIAVSVYFIFFLVSKNIAPVNPIPVNPVPTNTVPANTIPISIPVSPKDATYIIEGKSVTLVNGVSEVSVTPNSASKVITRYFGNEVTTDLNGDKLLDSVFILTQNTGGSGTFYYVVAALGTTTGYIGSKGFLLGDRISPQTTQMSKNPVTPGVIVVNYADRKPGESFAAQASVGKSIMLKLDTKSMQFGEVVKDFEGEPSPSKMTLDMKTWNWAQTIYSNDTKVVPKTNKFTITLNADETFSAKTDCNGIGGEYELSGNKITFTKMMSALMYCEGSQEQDYSRMLTAVQSYLFTSKGELIFNLKLDTGTMIFR
jgi:heat shock protein HslJ